jgi:hypothetical protein
MYYFEQLLYEQAPVQTVPAAPPPPQQQQQDFSFNDADMLADEDGLEEPVHDVNTSSIPIKRYYLIQKLFALNDKLNQLRIRNDVLRLVISFVDSFTYESLLSITNKLAEEIYIQVNSKEEPEKTTS